MSKYHKEVGPELLHAGQSYLDFMSILDITLAPRNYFEIGTCRGESLRRFTCDAVCVDPCFMVEGDVLAGRRTSFFFKMTSDEFFRDYDLSIYLGRKLDLAFLNGMQLFEFRLRDFINTEKHCHPRSVVLMPDCLPTNERMAERAERVDEKEDVATRYYWSGDVWRLLPILKRYRPELRISILDASPTGLVACTNLDPNSRVLAENYDRILDEYINLSLSDFGLRALWTLFKTFDTVKLSQSSYDLELLLGIYNRIPSNVTLLKTPSGSGELLTLGAAVEVSTHAELLLDHTESALPNCCAYSNLADFNPAFARHVLEEAYAPRVAQSEAIHLCTLPPHTLLYGGSFMTSAGGCLLQEQTPPYLAGNLKACNEALGPERPIEDITEECIVLGRYGDGTWGHWLGELLPRAMLAEQFRPGRFKFLVADWITRKSEERGLSDAEMESLAAYGITQDRLLPVRPDRNYRLRHGHLVTSVWTDHIMHPGAAALMRELLDQRACADRNDKIVLLRSSPHRSIANFGELASYLAGHGFGSVEVARLPFLQQAAVFRSASTVFGTLGSDLTGLLYAPDHVKVLAVAPGDWGDRFFYAMVQLREGRYAEVRGPVAPPESAVYRDSAFSVDLDLLDRAMRILGVTATQLVAPAIMETIQR